MANVDPSIENASPKPGGIGGLVAILISIVIGGLVGYFYGETMWMATGGPTKRLDKLEQTKAQKAEFAATAEKKARQAEHEGEHDAARSLRAEAAELRGHIPKIEAKIEEVEQQETAARTQKSEGATRFIVAEFIGRFTTFLGDMFLQTLRLLVIPLVVTSMICGVTSLGDVRKIGRLGGWTLSYYMGTAGIAVLLGILLVQVIRPGEDVDKTFAFVEERVQKQKDANVTDTLLDVFRGKPGDDGKRSPGKGMFPPNLVAAANETNVLGLIVFSLFFGGALTTIGEKGRAAIQFFEGANEAVMKLVHLVMFVAPIGIYGLVASKIAENGGASAFGEELSRLAWYAATVLIGLAMHVFFLAALLPLLARRNPFIYTYNMLRALLTAMSTASSSATLPVTIECCTEKNKVSARGSGFVLPLGATVNMDGTALYEAVAVIFIAQSIGMPLTTAQLVIIFLTATLAAIGAAGIPEAGLVTMVLVLNAAGVPMTGIGTILAIDWFLDRMRTTVNVYGDSVGAAVVDRNVVRREGVRNED
jgi:Na+/H+-dicarboxylate symporter